MYKTHHEELAVCEDIDCIECHKGCSSDCYVCHEECEDHPCEDCLASMTDKAMDMFENR